MHLLYIIPTFPVGAIYSALYITKKCYLFGVTFYKDIFFSLLVVLYAACYYKNCNIFLSLSVANKK